jgi:imidazole glycerol-phosphate synthase subunit HisF
MVLSIEAKRHASGWEVYTDCGRERSGVDVLDWARKGVELGAGEVLITSIDQEGTRKGFDIELTRAVSQAVSVPIIASGGYGTGEHLRSVVVDGCADAVAIADALHYGRTTLAELRAIARAADITVRQP